MNMFSILFLLILATNDCGGLKIELAITSHSPLCDKGYRADSEPYNITAFAGPNITSRSFSRIGPLLELELLKVGDTKFTFICFARIGHGGALCQPPTWPGPHCYCDNIDATTGTAHIVYFLPELAEHSQNIIRAAWPLLNLTRIYSSNNITLPTIYDVNDANLTLSVNDLEADNSSESCGLSFKPNVMNTIKLCCSETAEPCYPRLAFNGTVVAENQSVCVEYKFTASKTVNVTKSYSVCSLTEYITRGFCVIETRIATTTVTTTSSSTTTTGMDTTIVTPTGSSPTFTESPPRSYVGLILGHVLGFAIPIPVAVTIGLVIICLKDEKKNVGHKGLTGNDSLKEENLSTSL